MAIDQEKVWTKIFGIAIDSHTHPDMKYTIALTTKGWICDCMDFKIREGSYEIIFDTERFQACKHVHDHLVDLQREDMDKTGKRHILKWRKIGALSWREDTIDK